MCLAVTSARAGELHGRIRETWTRISTDADPDYTDTVVQDYQLNFRNMIARNLSWQMRLRALLQGSDRDDTTAATDTALLEPFFQIVYEGPAWQASGGARMTRVTPKGGGSTAIDRERRDFFGRVEWSDEIADAQSMDVSWSFYRLEREEDGVNLSEDDRSILSVGYLASPGGITVGVENRNSEDLVSGFERDAVEFTASGDLRHTFSAAKLTIAGRALASEQFRDEYTPRAIDVEVQRDARAGLFGVDNTAGMDPLMDTPGLIDGDRNSTAVDIDGRDRNYGADFGFPKDIERVLLYLERRLQAGNEQDFAFDVYTSDDGDLWTIRASFSTQEFHSNCSDLDPGRSQTPPPGWCFEPLQNRFEIRISPSQARFVKVVNTSFSSAEVPLGVTEIQIFGEERRTGRTEFDASRQSGNLTFGWRPSTPMTVNLHFVGSRLTNGGPSMQQTEEDFTSTLASSYRSARNVTTTGRLQAANRNSTTGRPERDRVTSLSVAGSPVPDVDLSASGTRRRNSTPGGVISANDSINLRGAVRLAAHTQTSLDLSFARLDNREIGRIQNRRVGRCALVTTLRPGLLLTNDWTVSRLEFESDEDLPSRTDFDLRSRISYRPSQVLGGSFEYLYQDVAGRQGTSRLLDVDWLPFPGGALQLQFTLVRDRLGDRGAVLDEERVGMRWTLNPRTLFESNYGTVRRGDATGTSSSRSLSAFLEFRF
jgi:hypothetical protein